MPDDPYPVADVRPMPDLPGPGIDSASYRSLESRLRRLLAGLTELGDSVEAATFDLADDPALGTLQMGALGPFTSYDRQRLLEADLVVERCGILNGLLDGAQGVVDMRLGLDWDAGGPATGSSR